ncbi:uncharacterized protein LOC135337747 [Halichondria panicea]|uniref:uncharacterized protein LOC135337747 n=1 Tax=Halichondria panicea TaxID=6063 RepID=UPI00312B5F60
MASLNSSTFAFMIVGKTGVGKSSIINSVAGSEVAPEGDELDTGTYCTESYEIEHCGSKIQFWDTPGLFDTTSDSDMYLKQIQEKYEQCDLILFCSDMTDTRVTAQDKRTIHAFTQFLGTAFWHRAIFVLTFGNNVEHPRHGRTPEYFKEKLEALKSKYREVLIEAEIPSSIVTMVPFIPAGYHPWSPDKEMYILQDGKNWISTFFMACFARVKKSQQNPVFQALPKRQVQSAKPVARKPTRDQCTFNASHRKHTKQDWFECKTCWGGVNSQFGCCWPCALDCHRGHQIVAHHKVDEGRGVFFCDCGLNNHQPAVCTFYSTKQEFRLQPYYKCLSCFKDPRAGVCFQCMINCHLGHNTKYDGVKNAFCDCGLQYCAVRCKIPEPRSYK